MKDTGEQTIQITLDELGPKRFLEWLRAQSDVPVEHIVKAHRLPFVQVMREFEHWYCDYLYSVVSHKVTVKDFDVLRISVNNHPIKIDYDWINQFYKWLINVFKSEFGINGMTPRPFVSAIIKHAKRNMDLINISLGHSRRKSVTNRTVSEKIIRASCLLCREWENLTNLLYEMALYISKSGTPEEFQKWSTKLSILDGFSESMDYLNQILSGEGSVQTRKKSKILTIDHKITVILDAIRNIRNKVAHPSSLTVEEIERLVEYSEYVLRKLKNACPLLARVVSVKEATNGLKEIGFYTEVDQQRKQPRHLLYIDVFGTGDEPDPGWIDREVIIFPAIIERDQYKIDVEAPGILLRKQEFVKKIHSVTDKPVTISVIYTTRKSASETYISSQAISLDE